MNSTEKGKTFQIRQANINKYSLKYYLILDQELYEIKNIPSKITSIQDVLNGHTKIVRLDDIEASLVIYD